MRRQTRISTLLVSLALAALTVVLIGTLASAQGADDPISGDELRALTYPNDFTADNTAPLVDGFYSEAAAPGSAALVEVRFRQAGFGAVDGTPGAAVVLATSSGGSGTFYDLHLVQRDPDGALVVAASRSLGDRIRLQDVRLDEGDIQVHFTGLAPDDPFCCPTINFAQEFRAGPGGLQLVRARQSPALLAVPEGPSLIGWYGSRTTSTAILGSAGLVDTIWAFNAVSDTWVADSRELPPQFRTAIDVGQGRGLFVIARAAAEIPVPLVGPPDACPLNPGPTQPVDPSMILQQPGNGESLSGPFTVAGLARVFEATVSLRLLDADGAVLLETFTTASAGGPEFGDFSVELDPAVSAATPACLQVFESSARDGSQVNVVQVGVTLLP